MEQEMDLAIRVGITSTVRQVYFRAGLAIAPGKSELAVSPVQCETLEADPRLVVTRSNRHMVAQVVDDTKGITLVSASTLQADFAGFEGTKTEAAKKVGELIAEKAKAAGITAVVFDRGGNKYTGRVAAVADGAREGGLAL